MKRSIIDILDLSTQELEELIATAEDIIADARSWRPSFLSRRPAPA